MEPPETTSPARPRITEGAGEVDRPDVGVHPPSVYIAAFVIGFILRVFLPLKAPVPLVLAEGVGAVVMLIGFVFAMTSVAAFAADGEQLRPATASNALFTEGPYRFSRNPIYLAMTLLLTGFGLATANLWMVFMAIGAAWLVQRFVILPEEQYLQRRFGADYEIYRGRVRRWI